MPRTFALAAAVAVLLSGLGCSDEPAAEARTNDDASSTPAATASTPTSQAAVAAGDQTRPEVARAMAHIEHLSVAIGPRPAGSEAERAAAAYLVDQLAAAGYRASVEEFTFEAAKDDSTVTLPDGAVVRALAMEGAANDEVSATAVHGGLGRPEDLAGADLDGKVVIFDRGIITFADKARAAVAGGAVAVIVVNDEPGLFLGSLGDAGIAIPVVAVPGEAAAEVEASIGRQITVVTDAGIETITSQNVVGRIGDSCHAYLGGHYDTVAVSPGANDNASGTAVVLEVARTNPVEGLCVILFGAEELGLFGSQNYVAEHLAGTARFMLNIDMAGVLDSPMIVGDRDLTREILEAITDAGVASSLRAGRFPPFASSDHVSFEAVGVPSVTFNAGADDEVIHTPGDTFDRIEEATVSMLLDSVDAALDALVAANADALAR
ncbi:MAG: M28 family metallopeptidase [Dehalococcoidia bacterium]